MTSEHFLDSICDGLGVVKSLMANISTIDNASVLLSLASSLCETYAVRQFKSGICLPK